MTEQSPTQLELLECLNRIGRALLASGNPVGFVKDTLESIARAYDASGEFVVFPNALLIKLSGKGETTLDVNTQTPGILPLDQISDLAVLIDRVMQRRVLPAEASERVDAILARPMRFGMWGTVLGIGLAALGLALRTLASYELVLLATACGLVVGLMRVWFIRHPRYMLLSPVVGGALISGIIFTLAKMNYVLAPSEVLIPPLVSFLPGVVLTTAFIELASGNFMSGSSRLMYGFTTLMLLVIGIGAGLQISGLNEYKLAFIQASQLPWWAPLVGTLIFGFGIFLQLSGRNRDFGWMLAVLYMAQFGQSFGEQWFGTNGGAFLGALAVSISAGLIARSPLRAPALVTTVAAFWFLVPGARGVMSFTSLMGLGVTQAITVLGQMVVLMIMISLGMLVGTQMLLPRLEQASTDIQELTQRLK